MASNRSLFIFFFSLSVLLSILLGILPFILESNLKSLSQLISKPHADNSNVWAQFPGKLQTSLEHSFRFFTLKEGDKQELVDGTIKVEEKVQYDNFIFDAKTDQISFTAKRDFTSNPPAAEIKVNTLSLGMLELYESISNYPPYQKGIIAMNYLIYKGFGSSGDFIKKLFTVSSNTDLMYDKDRIKETLLFAIKDDNKKNKIIDDPTYGLFTKTGYIEWAKLIGKDIETLKKAKWLKEVFDLTDAEISLLLGTKSFLNQYFFFFNEKLKHNYKCPKNPCGDELIFLQLQNQTMTKSIGLENVKKLNEYLDPSAFPYEHSIEMSYYYKLTHPQYDDALYEDTKLSIVQFQKLLLKESDSFIFDTINAINLLDYNATNNLYSAYSTFLIKSIEQMTFITNYFYDFLPNNMLFGSIKEEGKTFNIDALSKGYLSLVQNVIDTTYGLLVKDDYLLHLIYNLVMVEKIKLSGLTNLCPRILQLVLNDQIRVRNICKNPEYNMENSKGLWKWSQAFLCKIENCKSGIIEEMKKTFLISDKEFEMIYHQDYLGEYLIPAHDEIVKKYQCDKTCSNEYLTKEQFSSCEVTKNPPETIKHLAAETLATWDSKTFPEPIEFGYYQNLVKCKVEDCSEEAINALISLDQLSQNLFSFDNVNKFKIRIIFEQIHSLYVNGVKSSSIATKMKIKDSSNFFAVLDLMIISLITKHNSVIEYNAMDILYGSNQKGDEAFLNVLRNGNPIENYKPKIDKVTGFNVNKESQAHPTVYTIVTSQNDKTQILRRIVKINNTPFISINKQEYSMTKKEMVSIHTSLFNFYQIDHQQWTSDGFQYDANLESIYYFDELSSRVLKFDYKRKKSIDKLFCYEYVMNDDIAQGIREKEDINDTKLGQATQKFNKPFVVSSPEYYKDKSIDKYPQSKESTICVDPYSNMVIESSISLVYSIHTKNFNYLNPSVTGNKMIPLIYYERKFSITDQKSYDDVFEGVTSYFSWRLVLIIGGCILIAAAFALGVFFFIKFKKELANPSGNISQNLLFPEESQA